MPDFHVAFRYLLHVVNLRHGTDGFTSPPKEGVLRIFCPEKSDGFGQHATSRPPKPLTVTRFHTFPAKVWEGVNWILVFQHRLFESLIYETSVSKKRKMP